MLSWQMRFGGARLSYISRIEVMRPFSYFREVMMTGVFRHFEHDHHFARMDDGTRMRDEVRFTLRYGILGRALGFTVIRAALIRMLSRRTAELKRIAESGEWERYVEPKDLLGGAIKITEPPARVTNLQRFA
jgi:ligand-binding SRPBCC domain-containing protein